MAQPPLDKIKKGETEPYLKNEGALEDYVLDRVCRETVLHRGDEPPLENAELAPLGIACAPRSQDAHSRLHPAVGP